MISTNLQGVAELVIRRARRQGFVVPREVREELKNAAVPETLWKDVLALARPALSYRHGRYYYSAPVSTRVQEHESQQRAVHRVIRQIIKDHQSANNRVERRGEERVEFVQAVKVLTEDQREITLLSRDLSTTGIRLIGTRRLLGQKVRVLIPSPDAKSTWNLLVRILWTCNVGEDLIENGGTFIEVSA